MVATDAECLSATFLSSASECSGESNLVSISSLLPHFSLCPLLLVGYKFDSGEQAEC